MDDNTTAPRTTTANGRQKENVTVIGRWICHDFVIAHDKLVYFERTSKKIYRTSGNYKASMAEYILNLGYGVKRTRGASRKYSEHELALHYCIYERELQRGYSAPEIATELGMPLGTLKNMVRCAEKIPSKRMQELVRENEEFINSAYRDHNLFGYNTRRAKTRQKPSSARGKNRISTT